MQGNFEKKVQEKLEDLHLQPSAPVWEKVELQIRPEGKRRRIIVWWLLGVLLFGGLWFLTGTKERQAGTIQSVPDATKPSEKKQTATTGEKEPNNSAPQKRTADNRYKDVSFHATSKMNRSSFRVTPITQFAQTGSRSMKALQEDKMPNAGQEDRSNKPSDTVSAEEKPAPSWLESGKSIDTVSAQKAMEEKTKGLLPVADSSKKKPVDKQKWAGKILLAAGMSNFLSSSPLSYSYASAAQSTSPGSMTSRTNLSQSSQKNFSFAIGYGWEKRLSDRLSVSVGLRYAFYSTLQKVGAFKVRDTAVRYQDKAFEVSGFYSSPSFGTTTQSNYMNRLHVVELPLGLQYRPFRRLPLSFTGGTSFGWIVHSNVLTYYSAAAIYYVNGQNNRRYSWNLFSAAQYTAISKGKLKISAGPFVQYNLQPLQKISSTRQHIFFVGLKTDINF